jgi:phosphonate transport system ATP-binding protein
MQASPILLADEPVSSLDEEQSKLVLGVLCKQFETVVLALHDIDLALHYSDRIIGLKNGKICLDEATTTLTRNDLLMLYNE